MDGDRQYRSVIGTDGRERGRGDERGEKYFGAFRKGRQDGHLERFDIKRAKSSGLISDFFFFRKHG